MAEAEPTVRALLRLTLTPGLGPVLVGRLLEAFGSVERIERASRAELERVSGIGRVTARAISEGLQPAAERADREVALAEAHGVRLIARGSLEYPPLLAQIADAPPLLYVRGALEPSGRDAYPVAIVGSRSCTSYGIEQAERFAGVLARSGLTIVSGGARGIDSAAHRGAMRAGGRTIAVLGCGLAMCYPPDNAPLFERIANGDGSAGGAVVSELPMETAPSGANFPARNRLISGMSLGVVVVEAGRHSGALLTARYAAEDHGREVMVVPGRVDSPASEGALELIRQGGATLVCTPGDVLEELRPAARHLFDGTHAVRYADPTRDRQHELWRSPEPADAQPAAASDLHRRILQALHEPATVDELAVRTGLSAARLRAELTLLELSRQVRRVGEMIHRNRGVEG